MPYAWSGSGNLLDDGVKTYTYDHANRLTMVYEGDNENTYTFAYNGLADRLGQALSGEWSTQYTLDLAAGLTQVLSDGTNTYLYGVGRIGEQQPDGWQYHLGDALGSVRQLADEAGAATLAQSYQPYGALLDVEGDLQSIYGFTGEQMDWTGLTFLRARYYAPWVGLLTASDAWPGQPTSPGSLHEHLYAAANPVNHLDPSGNQILIFDPMYLVMPADDVILMFKLEYAKVGPIRVCALEPPHRHSLDNMTVDDLLTDFICEWGKKDLEFGSSAHLTQQLARTSFISRLRSAFALGHGQPLGGRWYFHNAEFLAATIDSLREGDPARLDFGITVQLNIVHFLGTFDYDVRLDDGLVRFHIENETSLESGTRILELYGGVDPSMEGAATTIEELVEGNPSLGLETVGYLVEHYPVISVLKSRTRAETDGLLGWQGGGTMTQKFTWHEPASYLCGDYSSMLDGLE